MFPAATSPVEGSRTTRKLLPTGFCDALGRLGSPDRWLDIGAGDGQAILDYYAPEGDAPSGEKCARGSGITIIPGLGLLPDDFADPYLKIFDLRDRSAATVAPGVAVPLQPFLGTMGVPTDEPGRFEPFPPHKGGGNVDCRHLIAGSTLWLPVWCEGALFSCGDPHAAQGDGEVCVTAIECGMDGDASLPSRAIAPSAVPDTACRKPLEARGRTTGRWGSIPT